MRIVDLSNFSEDQEVIDAWNAAMFETFSESVETMAFRCRYAMEVEGADYVVYGKALANEISLVSIDMWPWCFVDWEALAP